jgi:hypothetical protein
MNMKTNFVLVLTLFFALIPSLSYSHEMIELTASKTNYTTSDSFVVNIANQNELPTSYYRLSVEQLVNGQWTSIRSDTGCPCGSKCKKSPIELPTNKIVNEIWDFKDNQCDLVKKGEYRLVLLGGWDSAKKTNRTMALSPSFHID